MKPRTGRHAALLAALTAAGVAGAAAAPSEAVRGTIAFEGGARIPPGCVEVHLEGPALDDAARPHGGSACIESDGKSKAIPFSVPRPSKATASSQVRVVAQLTRPDGWLIARGSARSGADAPVHVTLRTVMY